MLQNLALTREKCLAFLALENLMLDSHFLTLLLIIEFEGELISVDIFWLLLLDIDAHLSSRDLVSTSFSSSLLGPRHILPNYI